jgi:NAD-dependent deacetylase
MNSIFSPVHTTQTRPFSERLIPRLKKAQSVVVLTGAGVSAESGISTFRDPDGLWADFKPEDLATPEAFRRNPKRVWEWYAWRREKIKTVRPNPGHFALAELEMFFPKFTLITQNVDGLHLLAGSKNVLELHGNIHRNKCFTCQNIYPEEVESKEIPPRCNCGGWLRPDLVWFGEMLPAGVLEKSYDLARDCEIFFSVGTSALVHPAASLPICAKERSAFLVEINPNQTEISHLADQVILGKSGEILPQLVSSLVSS